MWMDLWLVHEILQRVGPSIEKSVRPLYVMEECFKLLIQNRLCNVFFYSTYLLDKLLLVGLSTKCKDNLKTAIFVYSLRCKLIQVTNTVCKMRSSLNCLIDLLMD